MTETVSARSRNPLAFLDAEIEDLKAKGLYRRLRVVQSEQRSRCVIDGREVITLSSNNYLGLNTHPHLREAAIEAVRRYGAGSGALDVTPIITHRLDLADWEQGFDLLASRHAGKVVLLP